ncbi:MAG: superoxide dismutase [Ni] [Candidatus Marinimicrobia bacterium]|nr:superoxide dismutase [Ni] [Candidatus Neomarinimicrobiota bacterium]MDD5540627.1 superoxide dismutase [Ni] [Candidatus Neomarinimicrobiota bacterium]
MNMPNKFLAVILIIAGSITLAGAHCQIPCGIYGDETRFTLMREHVATIEKSMHEIEHLSQGQTSNNNQLVRWVMNKDAHADELAEIITYYFMAQRIKPTTADNKTEYAKYIKQITLLHQMLVLSMNTKQTLNLDYCAQIRVLIDEFEKIYLSK